MKLLTTRSCSNVFRRVAVAALGPLLCMGTVDAHVLPFLPAAQIGNGPPTRVNEMARRPRHIRTSVLRADLRGDTPSSSRYFSITNVTAEVHGYGGMATAVNNDGRIVYDDLYDPSTGSSVPYVINNGGGVDALPFPIAKCASRYFSAFALNERAEVVGTYQCNDPSFTFEGFSAWALFGATGSTDAYYDQRFSYLADGSFADSVNDSDVAVGCDGECYWRYQSGSAAIFEPWHDSKARIVELRGLRGRDCYATATAINNAGEIVGFACDRAVRFSRNGYAEPIPGSDLGSSAEAINESGQIVGYYNNDNDAFLYAHGRMTRLPFPAGYGATDYAAIAYGINASGEVVGTLNGAPDGGTAFVYLKGRSYDLNKLIAPNSGWQIADAFGINDSGEIVGDGYYNGNLFGIALKPPR